MGNDMNVKNLPPAQQALYYEQKELGKSDEEAYKYAVAEGLSTKQDPVDSSQIPNSEPEPKEETPWYAKAGMALLGVGGLALAVLTKGKAAKIGMGMAAVSATGALTSCAGDNTINQEVNINLDIKNANSWQEIKQWLEDNGYSGANLETIIKLLQDNNKDMKEVLKALEAMGKKLDAIYEAMLNLGIQADVIINLLGEMGDKVDILIDNSVKNTEQGEKLAEILNRIFDEVRNGNKLVGENNKLLTEILGMLRTLQAGDQDKIEALNAILAKLEVLIQKGDQLDENDKKTQELLGKILAAINKLDGDLKVGVLAILKKMDKMDANNLEMLTKILEKIEQGGNDKDYTDILNAILAKLNESVDNGNKMGEELRALLNSILDNIQNFNADMKDGINALLAKIDQLSEQQAKYVKVILEKMDQMDKTNQNAFKAILCAIGQLGSKADKYLQILANGQKLTNEQLNEILKAIIESNNIAKNTQSMIADLGDLVNRLGAELFARLEKGQLTLDEIKDLIAQFKNEVTDGQKATNEKLTFIGAILNNFIQQVGNMNEETKSILLAILAKIPEGCHCGDVDLKVIIEKLEIIIQTIKDNPEGNHEGILDDLDDLLG